MRTSSKTLAMIEEVAKGLGELSDSVVFVGGATTELYIDDPGAPEPTPTDDVDCVVQIASKEDYAAFERRLRKRGFTDPIGEENVPICRKAYRSIAVDVMPTNTEILGFTNAWYEEAIANKIRVKLPGGTAVFIFSVPYFIATKLEAYRDRGSRDDIRVSQDVEDLCAVLDGCTDLLEQVSSSPEPVRAYIRRQLAAFLRDESLFEEAAYGFIVKAGEPPKRVNRLMAIARAIAFP